MSASGQVCKKCGYERQPFDIAAETECPKCGAIYAKVEQHLERLEAEAAKRREAEEQHRQRLEAEAANQQQAEERRQQRQQAKLLEAERLKRLHKQVVVKTYKGNHATAMASFQADAAKMAEEGYLTTSQSWAPGTWGLPEFVVALLLCLILVGFLVFVYMLLVKPNGTLTVTYQRSEAVVESRATASAEKTCPMCAEQVKAAAELCRFCGHKFG